MLTELQAGIDANEVWAMTGVLRGLADGSRSGTPADRFRQRRFSELRRLIDLVPRPVRILDVGGTTVFWERLGLAGRPGIEVVLLNLEDQETLGPTMSAVVGDARDLSRYPDRSFDLVISNSVIEHLPTLVEQTQMSAEIRRVGARFYVQTPNRYFPLEPHFLFPFFALLPLRLRAWLLQHMDLGWHRRQPDRQRALADVRSIRLMTGSELARAFPGARLTRERFLGMTKSFIVLGGWSTGE